MTTEQEKAIEAKKKYRDVKLPFGKYSGELLADVPNSYLGWLADQEFVENRHPTLYRMALLEKKYRSDFDIVIE